MGDTSVRWIPGSSLDHSVMFCLWSWYPPHPPSVLVLFCLISRVAAVLTTVLIDDEFGDSLTGVKPRYSPLNGWMQGAECRECGLGPNAAVAYRNTWHEPTRRKVDLPRRVDFSFTGTTLNVYCIILTTNNRFQQPLEFTLDGRNISSGDLLGTDDVFQYNVSVFSIEELANTSHSFTMWTPTEEADSALFFDYATYSYEGPSHDFKPTTTRIALTPRSSSDSKPNLAVILGGVFGGLFFIIVILFAVLYHLRWRRRQRERRPVNNQNRRNQNRRPTSFTIDPFILNPPRPTMPRYNDFNELPYYNQSATPRGSSTQLSPNRRIPSNSQLRSAAVASNTDSSSSRPSGPGSSAIHSQPSSSQLRSIHTELTIPSDHGVTLSSPPPEQTARPRTRRPRGERDGQSRRERRRERRRREREITELRREVQVLKAQHEDMVQNMRPPPEYEHSESQGSK